MIKKGDILMYSECLEAGDDSCLMLALEDESTPSQTPMVRTRELNTSLPLPPENFFEAKFYKVVGHVTTNDTAETLVKKYLPKEKWQL